jgi:hypothetical protein
MRDDPRRSFCARAALLLMAMVPATSLAQTETITEEAETAPRTPRNELERRQATIPTPEPPTQLFAIHGGLLGTLQWIANADKRERSVFGAGSFDLNLILRPLDSVRLFLDAEGLAGRGPDQTLGTLSRLHTDADRLEGRERRLIIRELFVRITWLDEHVRFSIGKLDPGHYFDRNFLAEDETTQFLDTALLNSPALRPPPNGPGAALRVSVGDWRYALGVQAPDDVGGDLSGLPFMIGELGHRNIFALPGHYRWWTRIGSVPDARDRLTWGTGVSIDQLVTREVGVFLRAGLSRSEGEDATMRAWSGGVQVTPRWIGRDTDRLGLGYSVQREAAGREELVETYYTAALADWLLLATNVQWLVTGPNGIRGGRNRNVVVPGLRALFLF